LSSSIELTTINMKPCFRYRCESAVTVVSIKSKGRQGRDVTRDMIIERREEEAEFPSGEKVAKR
jgi:hypothetical protein